jgi:uncharacterized membrane protein
MGQVVDYVVYDTTNFKKSAEWDVQSTISDLNKEYPECTVHQVSRSIANLMFLVMVKGYMESRDIEKYVDNEIRELRLKIKDKIRNK